MFWYKISSDGGAYRILIFLLFMVSCSGVLVSGGLVDERTQDSDFRLNRTGRNLVGLPVEFRR